MRKIALLSGAAFIGVAGAAQAGDTHIVDIWDDVFFPPLVYANSGDTIRWVNGTTSTQSATAEDESWTTGNIGPGQYASITVTSETTLSYYNEHVEGASGYITLD